MVYDNDAYISWFPQGLAYIAAVLRKHGHQVTIYNQDVYHWPDEHLTDYLNEHPFDLVGIGIIAGYYQYRKLLKLSECINRSVNRPLFVLGGHGPSPEPEFFIKKTGADAIVIGEGERTIIDLVDTFSGERNLSDVDGVAFMDANGKLVVTHPRAKIENIDAVDFPAWDLFPIDHYALLRAYPGLPARHRCLPVLSSRGCIFACSFCYRMDEGFRARSAENILEEIDYLYKTYHITAIEFSDELLMSSEKRTTELCEGFLRYKRKFTWACNGRLNFATPSVLRLMKRAGCVFINYGIESLQQDVLNTMKKGLSVHQIHRGVQATIDADIIPGLNIIFGNRGETTDALDQGVAFLLKYGDSSYMRTIRPVTPYPGSDLYHFAIDNNLLKDAEDFYEHQHVNSDLLSVNFTNLSDEDFHQALLKANCELISNHYDTNREKVIQSARKLYCEQDVAFRGFRHS